jgi:hypothetical protein
MNYTNVSADSTFFYDFHRGILDACACVGR